MAAQITYVPVSGGSTITLNFGTMGTLLKDFRAWRQPNAGQAISIGGKHYAVVHDQYFTATARFAPVYFGTDSGSSLTADQAVEWAQFHAWVAHAQRGKEWTFAVDENNTWSTLMNGAQGQGDQNVQVDSTTGIATGEWVYFEDANDPTIWEKQKATGVNPGTDIVLGTGGLVHSYADNSIARYHEYFPACVLEPLDQSVFVERDGGNGAYYFDIDFAFRTVR